MSHETGGFMYSYLIGDLVFLFIWALLFYHRKDLRKEMLFVSPLFGLFGLATQYLYFGNWWHPQTITGTMVGIEDFLFGFCAAGIAAVIYEEFFKKRIKPRKVVSASHNAWCHGIWMGSLAIFFGSHVVFGIHTFWATLLTLTFPILIIWIFRPDLIVDSLASGFLLAGVSLPVYIIIELLTPGWFSAAWAVPFSQSLVLYGLPIIEEVLFYVFLGAAVGPAYEFWQEGKLVKA